MSLLAGLAGGLSSLGDSLQAKEKEARQYGRQQERDQANYDRQAARDEANHQREQNLTRLRAGIEEGATTRRDKRLHGFDLQKLKKGHDYKLEQHAAGIGQGDPAYLYEQTKDSRGRPTGSVNRRTGDRYDLDGNLISSIKSGGSVNVPAAGGTGATTSADASAEKTTKATRPGGPLEERVAPAESSQAEANNGTGTSSLPDGPDGAEANGGAITHPRPFVDRDGNSHTVTYEQYQRMQDAIAADDPDAYARALEELGFDAAGIKAEIARMTNRQSGPVARGKIERAG